MSLLGAGRALHQATEAAKKNAKLTKQVNEVTEEKNVLVSYLKSFLYTADSPPAKPRGEEEAEVAETQHSPDPQSTAHRRSQEHKRATEASTPAAPAPPPPAPVPAAPAAHAAVDSVPSPTTTEAVSATPPPPPPPPPGKVNPKGHPKPSPASTNGPPPPPPPPPAYAASTLSTAETTQPGSLLDEIIAAKGKPDGKCTNFPGGLTVCAYRTQKNEKNKTESPVDVKANEPTLDLMAEIRAAASKPKKKKTVTAPTENAGPNTAQSGASLGTDIPNLKNFLTAKYANARRDDNDWDDDDEETTSKQESFGQARRRFL